MKRQSNGLRYESVNYDEIIAIHSRQIELGGGLPGILYPANLEHIIDEIKTHKYGGTRREQILSKAAHLLQGIITTHPFVDGHKRTAVITTKPSYWGIA
jgi:death on curing protein